MRRNAVDDLIDKAVPEPNSGCWLWPTGKRYGQFWYGGRAMSAHRAAWLLLRGPIPDGLQVLHRCDMPPCVNPAHLFLGTQLVNRRDAMEKGRVASGERVGNAILTVGLADEIRALHGAGHGPTAIGKRLGLKRVTVSAVTTGRNWR